MRHFMAILVTLSMVVTTSCSPNINEPEEFDIGLSNNTSEYQEHKAKNAENVYYYNNHGDKPYFELTEEEKGRLRDVIGADSEDEERSLFINDYLQKQGIYREAPDGVTYVAGIKCAEYYVDNVNKKICFIIHDICTGSVNDDDPEYYNFFSPVFYCVSVTWDDLKKVGELAYEYDQEKEVIVETFYHTDGKRKTGVSYKYLPNIPFPIITDYKISDEFDAAIGRILNREDRFRFYDESTKYDETGRLFGYNGCLYLKSDWRPNPFFNEDRHFSNCFYDENDRLVAVKEDIADDAEDFWPNGWDYSSMLTVKYQDNGFPLVVEHSFFPGPHGTSDSSGTSFYDSAGRMAFREHYHTSGGYSYAYIYEGESRKPWAAISVGGMPASGEDDYVYGLDMTVYIFEAIL